MTVAPPSLVLYGYNANVSSSLDKFSNCGACSKISGSKNIVHPITYKHINILIAQQRHESIAKYFLPRKDSFAFNKVETGSFHYKKRPRLHTLIKG